MTRCHLSYTGIVHDLSGSTVWKDRTLGSPLFSQLFFFFFALSFLQSTVVGLTKNNNKNKHFTRSGIPDNSLWIGLNENQRVSQQIREHRYFITCRHRTINDVVKHAASGKSEMWLIGDGSCIARATSVLAETLCNVHKIDVCIF